MQDHETPKTELMEKNSGTGFELTGNGERSKLLSRFFSLLAPVTWGSFTSYLAAAVALVIGYNALDISPAYLFRKATGTQGYIFVDSPEIYTRERLINERLREDTWLNTKLEEADDPENLKGLVRTIKQRHDRYFGSNAAKPQDAATGKETPAQSVAGQSSAASASASSNVVTSETDTLTFNERVSIESSNRDFILQKLIENRLDDRHDLQGNSLYIFKFDNTVVTSEYSQAKAVVRVEIVPPVIQGLISKTDPFAIPTLSDNTSATLLQSTFRDFGDESAAKINRAIANVRIPAEGIPTECTIQTEGKSGSLGRKFVGENVAAEIEKSFGLEANELGIWLESSRDAAISTSGATKPYVAQPAGPDCKSNDQSNSKLNPIKLSFTVPDLNQYFDFLVTVQRDGKAGDPLQPVTAIPKSANFWISSDTCARNGPLVVHYSVPEKLEAGTDNGTQIMLETLALLKLDDGKPLSAFKLEYELPLYSYATEYVKLRILLRIINKAVEEMVGNNSARLVPWGRVTRRIDNVSNPSDPCTVIGGKIDTGFLKFVEKVGSYNSYSYSVLPRQSASSVVEQVLVDNENRLSGSAGGGTWFNLFDFSSSHETRSTDANLRSTVSSFGYSNSNGETNQDDIVVGWIIDPSASKPIAAHDNMFSVSESVLAIVSVPAWWPHVDLRIKKGWMRPNGRIEYERGGEVFFDDMNDSSNPRSNRLASANGPSTKGLDDAILNCDSHLLVGNCRPLRVKLPHSREIIEESILGADKRAPKIMSGSCDQQDALQVTEQRPWRKEITCVVEGLRLWRNTLVTLGVSEQTSLKILPNMNGLIAKFPAGSSTKCKQVLKVWTSEGVSQIEAQDIHAGENCPD